MDFRILLLWEKCISRARDTKLNRDVALKVLPEAFAQDAERMARFQREAQVLASLNHLNIASIYGLEGSGGVRALVMELVEGPTLAARLSVAAVYDRRADEKDGSASTYSLAYITICVLL